MLPLDPSTLGLRPEPTLPKTVNTAQFWSLEPLKLWSLNFCTGLLPRKALRSFHLQHLLPEVPDSAAKS